MIELVSVSARAAAARERGRLRPVLRDVTLRAERGALAIVGAPKDGTSLLFDVIEGGVRPRTGGVTVLGGAPGGVRTCSRVARVSIDAPLPDRLRVEEVCRLEAELRRTPPPTRTPGERLAVLGASALARRSVASLSFEERRTVALALALTSSADVLLIEEPLAFLDPVAPSLVLEALRAKAAASCVVMTTASSRDATALGDRLGLLAAGGYAPARANGEGVDLADRAASLRVVVASSEPSATGKARLVALAAALSEDPAVASVETRVASRTLVLVATGREPTLLALAVTRAIAASGVDVILVEPLAFPVVAIGSAPRAPHEPPASPPPPPPPAAGAP